MPPECAIDAALRITVTVAVTASDSHKSHDERHNTKSHPNLNLESAFALLESEEVDEVKKLTYVTISTSWS